MVWREFAAYKYLTEGCFLLLPFLPPTLLCNCCNLIKITFCLRFFAETGWGLSQAASTLITLHRLSVWLCTFCFNFHLNLIIISMEFWVCPHSSVNPMLRMFGWISHSAEQIRPLGWAPRYSNRQTEIERERKKWVKTVSSNHRFITPKRRTNRNEDTSQSTRSEPNLYRAHPTIYFYIPFQSHPLSSDIHLCVWFGRKIGWTFSFNWVKFSSLDAKVVCPSLPVCAGSRPHIKRLEFYSAY